MKASDIRDKSAKSLHADLLELRRNQFKLRMKGRTGQSVKYDNFKKNRRDVARICTVLNEMKRAEVKADE